MVHCNMILLVLLVVAVTVQAQVQAGVAPGDEDPSCFTLRGFGSAPTPAYSTNMRVLMDSWNYQNLLPGRTGAVWQQVDNDTNNPSRTTTNVIISTSCLSKLFIFFSALIKAKYS